MSHHHPHLHIETLEQRQCDELNNDADDISYQQDLQQQQQQQQEADYDEEDQETLTTPQPKPGQPSLCSRANVRVAVIDSDELAAPESLAKSESFTLFREDLLRFPVLGIDCEWSSKNGPPTVIQLATHRVCFVLVISKAPKAIEPFRDWLLSAEIVKTGVGIRADTQKMEVLLNANAGVVVVVGAPAAATPELAAAEAKADDDADAAPLTDEQKKFNKRVAKARAELSRINKVEAAVDLAGLVVRTPEANSVPSLSLARITQHYVLFPANSENATSPATSAASGLSEQTTTTTTSSTSSSPTAAAARMEPHVLDKSLQQSDWSGELTPAQVEYAADDAIAGLLCFAAIMRQHNNDKLLRKVQPTPAEFAAAFLKRKVVLKQPKTPSSKNRGTGNNNSSSGEFMTKMERRYQSPDDTRTALERIKSTGVKCYSVTGQLLFYVDSNKSRWYVKKGLAKVVEEGGGDAASPLSDDSNRNNNDASTAAADAASPASASAPVTSPTGTPSNSRAHDASRSILAIQLLFEPSRRTRICRSWHMGNCSLADSCPYAHGSEQLVDEPEDEEDATADDDNNNDDDCNNNTDSNNNNNTQHQQQARQPKQTTASPKVRASDADVATLPVDKNGIRTACDMCRNNTVTSDIQIIAEPVVPPAMIRLMGPEVAAASGASAGLHCCCKCIALLRAVHISERRLLRQDAQALLDEHELSANGTSRKKKQLNGRSSRTATAMNDDDETNNCVGGDDAEAGSGADEDDDDDENDGDASSASPRASWVSSSGPVSEAKLMSRINTASVTRFVSLCLLLTNDKRRSEIPADRVAAIIDQVNVFYDKLAADGLLANKVDKTMAAELQSSLQQPASDKQQQEQQEEQRRQRALRIAAEINHYPKSDWLSATEARTCAIFFLLRRPDDREINKGIWTADQSEKYLELAKSVQKQNRSATAATTTTTGPSLRVADPELAAVWAARAFEHFRAQLELQLRPVVVPWKKHTVDWRNSQARMDATAGAAPAAAHCTITKNERDEAKVECCICCNATRSSTDASVTH